MGVVGLIAVTQMTIVWYSHTYWPVDSGTSRFASTFCQDLTSWSIDVDGDASQLVKDEVGTTSPTQRRDLQAATLGLVTERTGQLADNLGTLSDEQPSGTASKELAGRVAAQMRSIESQLGPLQMRWMGLPVDTRSDLDQAKQPLLAQFRAITDTFSPTVVEAAMQGTTTSQRSLVRALRTTDECALFVP